MWQLRLKLKNGRRFSWSFEDIKIAQEALANERKGGANGFIWRNK